MEDKNFTTKQIITIILGVILTGISFCFYFLLKINWLNILCGIICFLFTVFQMYFQFYDKVKFTKKQRVILPTIILVVFYGILIALIAVINPLDGFCLDYILWTLFCGPSIIPVFYLILLIISFAP